MKKTLGLLFFGFIFSVLSYGQTWTRMQGWGLDLETVFWVNDSLAFAAGERLIIRTSNAGSYWEELPYTLENRILSISFWDSNLGIAVGEAGLILRTQDSGKSWQVKSSGLNSDLSDVSFTSENTIIIIGKEGKILRSEDAGESWSITTSGLTTSLNDLYFYNSDTAFITGANGRILRSYNAGQSWRLMNSGTLENINAIAFASPLVGYVVGNNGMMLKTSDGGESWTPHNSGVKVNLKQLAVSPADKRIIVAVGEAGTVIRSTDSGANFGKVNLGADNTRNLSDIIFNPTSNQLFITGQDGYLISSANGGSNYSQLLAGIRNNFTTTDFKSDRIGFIGGEKGVFFVTSNAGQSLVRRPLPEEMDIVGLDFWNTGFGYVSGTGGKIYLTGNAGNNWTYSGITTENQINGFYLFAPSVLYVSGNKGFVSRSFNTAASWDLSIETGTTENLKDLMFFDYQFGIAIGENGQLSWSNGGGIWQTLPKITENNLNALAKLNAEQAIVVGDQGVILKTNDKGKTWREINTAFTKDLLSVDFFDQENGFISGKNGLTISTKDGGETWVQLTSGTSRDLTSISVANPNIAFAVGEDGTILKYTCESPGNLSEISGQEYTCLSSQLYSVTNNPASGSEIVWRVDGGEIISGQGTNQIEVLWIRPGRQGVFVSRQNFCGSGETSFMEVLVNDIPPPNLEIEGLASVCEDREFTFSLPSFEGVSYTWDASGGEIVSGQGTSEVTIKWNTLGVQTLTALPENFCGKAEQIRLYIFVNEVPDQPGEIQGASQVALGESIYSIATTEPDLNYKWTITDDGGSILEGQGSGMIKVNWEKEGNFELQVSAQNTCDFGPARILPIQVGLITGLEPDMGSAGLKIFPNPSQGELTIESKSLSQWSHIEVTNAMGQVLMTLPIKTDQTDVQLEQLPRGIIFIRLNGRKGQLIKKVIIR